LSDAVCSSLSSKRYGNGGSSLSTSSPPSSVSAVSRCQLHWMTTCVVISNWHYYCRPTLCGHGHYKGLTSYYTVCRLVSVPCMTLYPQTGSLTSHTNISTESVENSNFLSIYTVRRS
jgi:hypothetical protein